MFVHVLRQAVVQLSKGRSVGEVARAIRMQCWSVEQAHLTARAAEVYARMLKRDVAAERWEAEKERRRERGRKLVVRWLEK